MLETGTKTETYYVYHIHTEGQGLDQGYVGVSVDPKSRWSRHKSKNSDSNPVLKRAIKKYNPKFTVLAVFDNLEDALWQEFTLRPLEGMGWNLSVGGGMPPENGGWNKGLKTPDSVRKLQSNSRSGKYGGLMHPRSKSANIYNLDGDLIAGPVCLRVWAKDNGFHQGHLSATARGDLKQHKGVYARYVT